MLARADVPRLDRRRRADEFVHRTVQLSLHREVAAEVREAMLSLGGTCAVSGIDTADQPVGVALGGTRKQFRQLVDDLDNPAGSRQLAGQLAALLDLDGSDSETERPAGPATGRPDESSTWGDGPAVMGILNVTPDSFHDGGQYDSVKAATERGKAMVEAGAAIVDIGGESTRPGTEPVTVETERERVVPIVEALSDLDVTLSIDTRRPRVAEAALEAGADEVNDVTGLGDAEMRHVAAERGVPEILMHSLSAPVDPDREYEYDDVVTRVREELAE